MARPIWNGAISFGLVSVPVKMYSAVDRKTVRFHQLSRLTGSRVSQKRVDAESGEEVAYGDIVKGFELTPDRYVIVEPAELDALAPRKTKTIEIEDFVELSEIDPIYYEQTYYLAPAPGGAKPYRLLLEAMRDSGRVAIAHVVIRSKEQLVAVRPLGDVLTMSTMVFADEILPPDRIDELAEAREVKTTKREVDVAKQLIGSLSGPFEPERYHDTYREEVLGMIERKAEGKKIVAKAAPKEKVTAAPDLMSALKASLDAVREREGAAPARKKRAAASKPAAKKPAAKSAGSARAAAKR